MDVVAVFVVLLLFQPSVKSRKVADKSTRARKAMWMIDVILVKMRPLDSTCMSSLSAAQFCHAGSKFLVKRSSDFLLEYLLEFLKMGSVLKIGKELK